MINDPHLAKTLCIKNFSNFSEHRVVIDSEKDKLIGRSLVSLKGEEWRRMRATLSPAFTSSKMRQMFDLVKVSNSNAISTLKNDIEGDKIFEMKEFFSNFTSDILATTAFGLETNSFANPENEFRKIALKESNPNGLLMILKLLGANLCPRIMKFFDIGFLEKSTSDFFRSTIIKTMEVRKKNQIFRPDMINLLIEAQRGKLKVNIDDSLETDSFATPIENSKETEGSETVLEWTDDDLVAQCLLFFLAGKLENFNHASSNFYCISFFQDSRTFR